MHVTVMCGYVICCYVICCYVVCGMWYVVCGMWYVLCAIYYLGNLHILVAVVILSILLPVASPIEGVPPRSSSITSSTSHNPPPRLTMRSFLDYERKKEEAQKGVCVHVCMGVYVCVKILARNLLLLKC